MFEDNTILPNMTNIPKNFINSNKEIMYHLINLMVLKVHDGKNNQDLDFNEKYQMYISADKTIHNSIFKNSIKIYRDIENKIYCPAILNQKTGKLLENYTDNDLFYIINIPHIFKFYSPREKDRILLE